MRLAHLTVESLQVKASLPALFRFKPSHLEFHGGQAVEAAMKKEEVQSEVPRTHLQRILGTDKAKVSAKLQHEIFHAVEQATVEVVFGMLLWQPQKLDGIGILKKARRFWMYFCHRR